jgi:hypothetical protein
MVTGSMAVNYYATPRMTRDIDLVVELSHETVDRIVGAFQKDFYVDRVMIEAAVKTKGMFNIIHHRFVIKVDFVVRKDSEYRRQEFSRRKRVTVEDLDVFLVAPEDLILSKLEWAKDSRSEMQLDDVRNLLASVRDLDKEYLARWADRLSLGSFYREVSG